MGYFEIIKKGFETANRNLWVLLTQFAAGLTLVAVFFVFVLIFTLMTLGSLPAGFQGLTEDKIPALLGASFSLMAAGVFFVIIFMVIAAYVTAFVHSGNLGCIMDTARGETKGFTAPDFFASARRSSVSMLGLYIVWGLFSLAVLLVLTAAVGVGFEAILIPLKDAGRGLLAFGLGVPFIILSILAGLLFLFILYAGWTFSGIILVGERKHAFEAISMSYHFIKIHFWDSLLFALFMFSLVFVANIVGNLFSVPFGATPENRPLLAVGMVPLVFLGVLFQMYIGLIARSSFAVFYLDRRIHMPPHGWHIFHSDEAPAGSPVEPVPGGDAPMETTIPAEHQENTGTSSGEAASPPEGPSDGDTGGPASKPAI
ncbi:MAG TPA: hypothetical protein VGK71_06815 [Nitrospirota bacterium]